MTAILAREIVTLDGPSGVGKTAVARALAGALGWRWVSAGMVYRAIAADETGGASLRLEFTAAPDGIADPVVRLGQRCFAERDLRAAALGERASQLATDPAVRARVHTILAEAATAGLVLEGRAMHRLAPHAAQHIYLWADPAERAARTSAIGERFDAARDARDRARAHDPMRVRAGMTVWNSTRYQLADTVAGLARRIRIALGVAKPVAVLLFDEASAWPDEVETVGAGTVELRRVVARDATAAAEVLQSSDVALIPPRGVAADVGWLRAHLRVLLAGNDIVSVGPVGLGLTSVTRNLTGQPYRDALAAVGNVGFTCDMLSTQEPAGTTQEWWMAAARGARWVFVPAARSAVPPVDVVHLRRPEDCDPVLDRLATRDGGAVVVVDHLGVPALPLLAEVAGADRGSVHVVGPDWLEA